MPVRDDFRLDSGNWSDRPNFACYVLDIHFVSEYALRWFLVRAFDVLGGGLEREEMGYQRKQDLHECYICRIFVQSQQMDLLRTFMKFK